MESTIELKELQELADSRCMIRGVSPTAVIYEITDGITFYIGATVRPLAVRLAEHLKNPSVKFNNRFLVKRSMGDSRKLEIRALLRCATVDASYFEQRVIGLYKGHAWTLELINANPSVRHVNWV